MTMNYAGGDAFAETLGRITGRRAVWHSSRSAIERSTSFSFTCTRETPVLIVSDSAIEDIADTSVIVKQCLDMYARHHAIGYHRPNVAAPIDICKTCQSWWTAPDDVDADSFEYCERQAVLWMQRAQERQR